MFAMVFIYSNVQSLHKPPSDYSWPLTLKFNECHVMCKVKMCTILKPEYFQLPCTSSRIGSYNIRIYFYDSYLQFLRLVYWKVLFLMILIYFLQLYLQVKTYCWWWEELDDMILDNVQNFLIINVRPENDIEN